MTLKGVMQQSGVQFIVRDKGNYNSRHCEGRFDHVPISDMKKSLPCDEKTL